MARQGSVVGDSILSTAGVLAQGLSRFAYTAIVGRMLGADVLSTVNVAFSVSILLSLVWPTAAGNAAAAFLRSGPEGSRVGRALARSVGISFLPLGVAAVVLAVVLGGSAADAAILAALTFAWSGYIFGRGARMGLGQVRAAAGWDLATAIGAIALLFAVIVLGADDAVLVPAILGYAVFATAALLAARRARHSAPVVAPAAPQLTPFIAWSSVALIATNGLMQLSMVVAFAFEPREIAGQFAAALSLATPVSMIAQAVTQALIPRFAEWGHLPYPQRNSHLRRALAAVGAIMLVGCGMVALLMPWVLPLVFGPGFQAAVPMAQWLMLAVFGFSLSVFLAAFLAATGRARPAMLLTGGASIVGLACMLAVGVTVSGTAGAIVGTVVGMTLAAVALAYPAAFGKSGSYSGDRAQ
jgi:O-antigen/teichoic acid export membrane protein